MGRPWPSGVGGRGGGGRSWGTYLPSLIPTADQRIAYQILGFSRAGSGYPSTTTYTSIAGARASLYAAGREASWVGKLVPDSYTNPIANTPRSTGLAGSLPLILGLMYVFDSFFGGGGGKGDSASLSCSTTGGVALAGSANLPKSLE